LSGEQFWAGSVAVEVGVFISLGLVISVVPVVLVVPVVSAVVLVVSVILGDEPLVITHEHADEMRDGMLWHCDT
jgi:hypothetical protein